MKSRASLRLAKRFFPSISHRAVFTSLFIGTALCAISSGADDPRKAAERLVRAAHEAALSGQNGNQFALLRRAIQAAPDFSLARWQLGHIEVDGQWLAVEEAQRRAAANPRQTEYRKLRETHGETPEGQLALARWCRKNDLHEEARYHWATVLSIEPNNEEALRTLGVRWHAGRLMTPSEINRFNEEARALKQAVRAWRPQVDRWQRAVGHADDSIRDAALYEIRSLRDERAIPALEEVTLGRDAVNEDHASDVQQISLALVDALDAMPEQASTESLLRHAVFSPIDEVRMAAIKRLKQRAMHDYVPLLLDELSMPIESSFSVITDATGSVHYRHSLYREGPESDWSANTKLSAQQHDFAGPRVIFDRTTGAVGVAPSAESEVSVARKKAFVASQYQTQFGSAASAREAEIAQLNRATESLNHKIIEVLTGTTEQRLGDRPTTWWQWWLDYNEYYVSDDTPVYEENYADTEYYYYRPPTYESFPPPTRMSCFAKGTSVWTKTGLRPIETLEMGELVLSQNVDTGELSYKPIMGRTVRPPTKTLLLRFDDSELQTTLGHPFWVAGVGWRMAKEVEDGAMLHAVTGAVMVKGVEETGQAEAFNLVVADFSTYFVGEAGVLVHDNTPRKPSRALVPGLVIP